MIAGGGRMPHTPCAIRCSANRLHRSGPLCRAAHRPHAGIDALTPDALLNKLLANDSQPTSLLVRLRNSEPSSA